MNEFYKIITYLTISFALSYLSLKIESDFIIQFRGDLLSLLTAIIAINITSASLIYSRFKELETVNNEFEKPKKDIKKELVIQGFLIGICFLTLIFLESEVVNNMFCYKNVDLIGNTILISIFIYFIATIIDLGKALFNLMGFKK